LSLKAERVPDLPLTLVTLILMGVGVVMVYSTSAILAQGRYGNSYYFILRQLLFLGASLVAGLYVLRLDADMLRRLAVPLMALAFLALVMVLVPSLSRRVAGARRWIGLGPFSLQPSEFAKLALVLFAADRLTCPKPAEGANWKTGVVPVLGAVVLGSVLLIKEPDFGGMALLAVLGFFMLFCAGAPLGWFAGPVLVVLPAMVYFVATSAYRMKRVAVFLDPWKDPQGRGFQIVHSMMAFGSGGLLGAGLGQGRQKLYYLPEPHTDFVFSTFGEEFGFAGCLLVLALFMTLLWRGFLIALRARDPFLKLTAAGMTCLLGLQTLINLFVVLGLAPTKGATLPFLSYGGSSLMASMICVAVILNVSRQPS
jgi:cell division protein FtsW